MCVENTLEEIHVIPLRTYYRFHDEIWTDKGHELIIDQLRCKKGKSIKGGRTVISSILRKELRQEEDLHQSIYVKIGFLV